MDVCFIFNGLVVKNFVVIDILFIGKRTNKSIEFIVRGG